MFGWFEKKDPTIETVVPGTMIVHHADGKIKAHEYGGETNSYYHEETAADYLCQPKKHVLVEIKDVKGKVFRYDQAAMVRLGWS